MKRVTFKLSNKLELGSIIQINIDDVRETYILKKYLGKGVSARVFLIRPENFDSDDLVLKISLGSSHQLKKEITKILKYFYDREYIGKPIYFGNVENYPNVALVYPYFGFTNLDVFKEYNYQFDLKVIKSLIVQVINQLKEIKPLIHCDLKPSNVVLDFKKDNWHTTIIDWGLVKSSNEKKMLYQLVI
jgi:serine/threonine protein kinase